MSDITTRWIPRVGPQIAWMATVWCGFVLLAHVARGGAAATALDGNDCLDHPDWASRAATGLGVVGALGGLPELGVSAGLWDESPFQAQLATGVGALYRGGDGALAIDAGVATDELAYGTGDPCG